MFRPRDGSPALVGVVGALQLDVLQNRLQAEYGLEIMFQPSEFALARWISADKRTDLEAFVTAHNFSIADDLDGDPVFMAKSAFDLRYNSERAPAIRFADIKDVKRA